MVLDRGRKGFTTVLEPLARRLSGISPGTLTAASFVLAVLAGILISLAGLSPSAFLLLSVAAVAMSGLFDALDGLVARITGKASRRGDFMDHLLDRYSDIFLISGFSLSYATSYHLLGLFALAGVFMTSYTGTQAEAVGLRRNYSGIMGRADRLSAMMVALVLQSAFTLSGEGGIRFYGFGIFDYLLLLLGAGGFITALHRALSSWREL